MQGSGGFVPTKMSGCDALAKFDGSDPAILAAASNSFHPKRTDEAPLQAKSMASHGS